MREIPKILRTTIARNIYECRVKKFPGRGGQKRCAEALNVAQQQLSHWEKGRAIPRSGKLAELANLFGVQVDDLRRKNESLSLPQEPDVGNGMVSPPKQSTCTAKHSSMKFSSPSSTARDFWLTIDEETPSERSSNSLFKRTLHYLSKMLGSYI